MTRGREALRALAMALALLSGGCDNGSPAGPAFEGEGTSGGSAATEAGGGGGTIVDDAGATDATAVEAAPAFAVCPPGLDASFTSLLTQMLATSSCGAGTPNNCHSTSGASGITGTGNLLDFSLDASAVYAELQKRATNIAGDASVLRVAPGDASASMLYIKLTLKTSADPTYGAGMPLTDPGSVCPATLDAIKTWIDQGAGI